MAFTIQKGHARGETLRETDEQNILAGIADQEAVLLKNPGSRTANFHREWLLAARSELALRRTYRFKKGILSAKAVVAALTELGAVTHLVTPSRSCVTLPVGTAVAVTFLEFNGVLEKNQASNRDVYRNEEGGDLSLRKEALNEIAKAAGISWLPRECRRVGSRSNPFYVEYKAAANWRGFDASECTFSDSRAVDLTDGSPEAKSLSKLQLEHDRRFILAIAESKAKARVIRELGVSLTYSEREFEKPFAVLRLVHTGRTKDKELNRAMALETQRAMTGSTNAMYGAKGQP